MRALALLALAAPFVAGCFHPAPPPDVGAVVDGDDPFEPAPSAVLTGERSCA